MNDINKLIPEAEDWENLDVEGMVKNLGKVDFDHPDQNMVEH